MKTRFLALSAGAALLALTFAASAGPAPERQVRGTTITSARDPAIRIELPASAQYLGADRWDLYDACDAELHVFVEAGPDRRVQRLYWVQFEQYLPSNDYTYDYSFEESLVHGGFLFDVTPDFRSTGGTGRPGSDREHVIALLTRHGYVLPPETLSVRLVNLLDDSRRKELMFIYAEDLAASGHTVEDLERQREEKWPQVKAALIARALERIRLVAD